MNAQNTNVGPAGCIRVAVVEDDPGTREGLAILINSAPGYQCAGAFGSVEEALRGMDAPDVLLLDIGLPGMPGSEGVKLFRARHAGLPILMFTVYADRDRVFESICNGACGYLLKTTPPDRLLEAIRQVYEGGSPMSPEVARKIVALFQKAGPPEQSEQRLTAQEARLLSLLAEGHSYLAAAGQMNVSVNTVRNYVRSVYEKLHVHSKSEAVMKAVRRGLIA